MTKKELRKLRGKLPHRYAEELSKRTGVKIELVRMIMTGHKKDYHGVIKAAAIWAKELKLEESQIRDVLDNNRPASDH